MVATEPVRRHDRGDGTGARIAAAGGEHQDEREAGVTQTRRHQMEKAERGELCASSRYLRRMCDGWRETRKRSPPLHSPCEPTTTSRSFSETPAASAASIHRVIERETRSAGPRYSTKIVCGPRHA